MARVTVRRVLLLAALVGVLFDLVVPGHAPGLNALVVTAVLLLAAALVADPAALRRFDPADAWLPVAALVLASMAAVRADPWLVTADVLLAGALVAGSIAAFAGTRITRGIVPRVLEAAGGVAAAACVGTLAILQRSAADRADAAGPRDEQAGAAARIRAGLRPWTPVLRGLLLAAPIVVLFTLLFASADAVFAGLARTALGFHVEADLDDLATRATVIAVVAWGAAGLLALAGGLLPTLVPGSDARPAGRSLGAASSADLARGGLTVGSTEAATVLVVVDLLFAAFVALQLAYLFGGRDTLALAGLTYADYARRGFFELVAVARAGRDARRRASSSPCAGGRAPARSRVLALLALTASSSLSAFVRLRLYQDAYGWTELRFVVLTAIVWLAVALAATAWLAARAADPLDAARRSGSCPRDRRGRHEPRRAAGVRRRPEPRAGDGPGARAARRADRARRRVPGVARRRGRAVRRRGLRPARPGRAGRARPASSSAATGRSRPTPRCRAGRRWNVTRERARERSAPGRAAEPVPAPARSRCAAQLARRRPSPGTGPPGPAAARAGATAGRTAPTRAITASRPGSAGSQTMPNQIAPLTDASGPRR